MMHTSQPIITTTPFDDTYHFALSSRQNDSFLPFCCTVEAIYAVFAIRCRFFEHPYVHLVCWICGFIYFCPAYFMAMLTEEEEHNEDI